MREIVLFDLALTRLTGNIVTTLLFCRLEQLFMRSGGAPFTKFIEPAPNRSLYKPGDSWVEELQITDDHFRASFDRIGVRFRSRTSYQAAAAEGRQFVGDDGSTRFYASYTDRGPGRQDLTYYIRNARKINAALRRLQQQVV
jgi:hypothetical protein